ncbi:DUF7471 family protein [Halorussus halobius]|uniref:DUF7471 family protein n=1 Tax=Halorussus halobius TaxID=1710537 RepID=UPI001B2FFF03|nr:hypothetical protein [Halorussus halobius]
MQLPASGRVTLHAAPAAGPDLAFTAVLALAGLGSAAVLGLALAALVRRRSRSYLLVTLALATLLARTGVAALSLAGSMDAGVHHWLEHGLDAAMAALVVAAVYDARAVRQSSGTDRDPSVRSDGGTDSGEREHDSPADGSRGDEP